MNQSIVESLRTFETFEGLSDDDLTVLAARARRCTLPSRSVLFSLGDNDAWIHCLTEGTLELVATDGRRRRIEAGTRAAGHPVASLRPRQYTATALTLVTVISIDGDDIGNWHERVQSAFEVEEFDDPEQVETQQEAADDCERLLAAKLALPSLPTIALQAQRVIDRDDAGIADLARLVLNDPSIAAKLVKAANSPVFYGCGNIETCERAIVRLGLKTTRQLVVAFAVRDLFQCKEPHMHARMQALWEHSAQVAAIAYVMARKLKVADPDQAQLAGLVHDIGGVPVLSYAASQPNLFANPSTMAELDARLRPAISPRLLHSWNFPEAIVAASRDAENWSRIGSAEPDLIDLVIVAHLISHLGTAHALQMPPLMQVPAFQKLFGDDISPQQITALLHEAHEEISELQGLLSN